MIKVYNVRDSYRWYRENLLKERLIKVIEIYRKTPKTYILNKSTVDKFNNPNIYQRIPVRFIEKYEKEYSIKDVTECPTMTVFINIVHGYFKFLVRKIFEGHDVKLGAKLGIANIRGKKVKPIIDWKGQIKGIAPSWAKTKQSWVEKAKELELTFEEYVAQVPKSERNIIYCFNGHSDGIKYRIGWYKKNVIVKNKTFYGLTFNRVNRRMLWKLINEGKEYLVIE